MSDRPERNWEKIWGRVGVLIFVLLVFLVAGPQVIDLFEPDFR